MKRIKMFCDPLAASIGISFALSYSLAGVFLIFMCFYLKPPLWFIIFLIGCYSVLIIASFKAIPQAVSFVELDSEGVRLNALLKKTYKIPYVKFKFFKIVYYTHIYKKRYFVVMGRLPISMSDLAHANKLQNSEDLIKIKLTKKSYNRLCQILPEWHKNQLENVLEGSKSEVAFDAEMFLKRQARKEKQRKKFKAKKNK